MVQTQLAAAELAPQAEDVFIGLWTSLFYTPPKPPKSVLICSSNRQEGSTTVACGLAVAGAGRVTALKTSSEDQDDQIAGYETPPSAGRVVLVDFNLRNPGVGKMLNIANGTGISNVLVGQDDLDGALQHIGPGNLDVLTAGNQCGRVLEILQADCIRPVLEELQRRYDQVIIDSAPVNQYPDAHVLAEVIGSVVLVAHCSATPRETLLLARKQVERGGGKVVGVVLNRRTYPIPKFVYRRV